MDFLGSRSTPCSTSLVTISVQPPPAAVCRAFTSPTDQHTDSASTPCRSRSSTISPQPLGVAIYMESIVAFALYLVQVCAVFQERREDLQGSTVSSYQDQWCHASCAPPSPPSPPPHRSRSLTAANLLLSAATARHVAPCSCTVSVSAPALSSDSMMSILPDGEARWEGREVCHGPCLHIRTAIEQEVSQSQDGCEMYIARRIKDVALSGG